MTLAQLSTPEIVAAVVVGVAALVERTIATVASRKANRQIEELWRVHLSATAIDEDGAPKWYVRKALTEAIATLHEVIKGLAETQRDVATTLRDLHRESSETRKTLQRMERTMNGDKPE